MNFNKPGKNSNHTLFLDRDGVINKKIAGGYVLDIDQFEFITGVIEAIPVLNSYFRNIFIVTNQQCVGKGLIDMASLSVIHDFMLDKIESGGGRVREVFVSPHLESESSPDRKPNIGMAIEAGAKYPEVDLSRSMMVGDTRSDMIFGRDAGMVNILIEGDEKINENLYDLKIMALIDLAELLEKE